ncbi:hypothetical protein [Streptomyces cyaneofuscatus]|uniref:hypothetical protein n=1 Tax=Streptomyces cyaneofuscatus TaxID=66883 RepID=UPI00379A22A1
MGSSSDGRRVPRGLVGATGPITLTEHDDATWADPGDLPAVSDETRALLAGRPGRQAVVQARV